MLKIIKFISFIPIVLLQIPFDYITWNILAYFTDVPFKKKTFFKPNLYIPMKDLYSVEKTRYFQ